MSKRISKNGFNLAVNDSGTLCGFKVPRVSMLGQDLGAPTGDNLMELSVEERKSIIEGYIAAYNAFDINRMISFVHPNIIFKNIVGDETNAIATGID